MATAFCPYCGEFREATDDHIPPKAFFKGELGASLRTVKSCDPCNNDASQDDEYFLHMVLKPELVSERSAASGLVEKMSRAIGNPKKAGYSTMTLNEFTDVEAVTPSGILLGKLDAFTPDHMRLQRATRRYVRGLHRHEYGEWVPESTLITTGVDPDEVLQRIDSIADSFRGASVTTIQEGVFWYASFRPALLARSSYWLLVFFDAFPIIGSVRPENPLLVAEAV